MSTYSKIINRTKKERNFSAQFKIFSFFAPFFLSIVDFHSKEIIHVEYKGIEEHHLLTFTADCAKGIEKGANSASDVEEI